MIGFGEKIVACLASAQAHGLGFSFSSSKILRRKRRSRTESDRRQGMFAEMMEKTASVYDPQEDSFLLQGVVARLAKGFVLDMGTGSGIQALTAARKKAVKRVLAVDISQAAIAYCKKYFSRKKITYRASDLFSRVKGRFDTIIFNPPYLPGDHKAMDVALEGGKRGYEVITRFLKRARSFLKPEGRILLVFSSLSRPNLVLDEAEKQFFIAKKAAQTHIFFEDLFVYVLSRSPILNELERKGVKEIQYLARGKRGMVFTGKLKGLKVAIKVKRPSSEAKGRIANEAKWLKILNKHGIGPKFVMASKLYLIYRFVPGEYMETWLEKSSLSDSRKVLKTILEQAFLMDKLRVNKGEMHRLKKNAVIKNSNAVLIDFERSRKTTKPHNVLQFCQFLITRRPVLEKKGLKISREKLIALAREYKRNPMPGFKALKELLT